MVTRGNIKHVDSKNEFKSSFYKNHGGLIEEGAANFKQECTSHAMTLTNRANKTHTA